MSGQHIDCLCDLVPQTGLATQARHVRDEFDRQAARAVTAALYDMPRLWPGITLGGVSGDAIAGAKAARKISTPDYDLWAQVRA